MGMKRRTAAVIATITVTGVTLAGCGGGGSGNA
ncbi:MAG: hypothetical protein JWO46_3441, partial [Nocardioidaceae bacterium]|nr:hypothetical protein [Nocardioidaceae bacterium]